MAEVAVSPKKLDSHPINTSCPLDLESTLQCQNSEISGQHCDLETAQQQELLLSMPRPFLFRHCCCQYQTLTASIVTFPEAPTAESAAANSQAAASLASLGTSKEKNLISEARGPQHWKNEMKIARCWRKITGEKQAWNWDKLHRTFLDTEATFFTCIGMVITITFQN